MKTLKDLPKVTIMVPDTKADIPCQSELVPEENIPLKELKQEAIKWVKEDYKLCLNNFNDDLYDIVNTMIDRWVDRFNITEDDLK